MSCRAVCPCCSRTAASCFASLMRRYPGLLPAARRNSVLVGMPVLRDRSAKETYPGRVLAPLGCALCWAIRWDTCAASSLSSSAGFGDVFDNFSSVVNVCSLKHRRFRVISPLRARVSSTWLSVLPQVGHEIPLVTSVETALLGLSCVLGAVVAGLRRKGSRALIRGPQRAKPVTARPYLLCWKQPQKPPTESSLPQTQEVLFATGRGMSAQRWAAD